MILTIVVLLILIFGVVIGLLYVIGKKTKQRESELKEFIDKIQKRNKYKKYSTKPYAKTPTIRK